MFAGIIEAIPGMLRYINSELLRSSCVVDIYCFIVFTTESRLSWYATSSIGSWCFPGLAFLSFSPMAGVDCLTLLSCENCE